MELVLRQDKKQIYREVTKFAKQCGTSLKTVCKEKGLKYSRVHYRLNSDAVSVDYIREIVQHIDSSARLKEDISLSLDYAKNNVNFSIDLYKTKK